MCVLYGKEKGAEKDAMKLEETVKGVVRYRLEKMDHFGPEKRREEIGYGGLVGGDRAGVTPVLNSLRQSLRSIVLVESRLWTRYGFLSMSHYKERRANKKYDD